MTELVTFKFLDQIPDMGAMGMPMPVDIKQLPIISYPMLSVCLGLFPEEPNIEIMEGFLRIEYDFNVSPASETCLFDVHDEYREKAKKIQKER